ncbi:hypothetical protein BC829DRAFT_395809 [Chytridium lagenaria]|nr:hypothetical protein BC829DRAFT_395809 [Chytridium lagenaria]
MMPINTLLTTLSLIIAITTSIATSRPHISPSIAAPGLSYSIRHNIGCQGPVDELPTTGVNISVPLNVIGLAVKEVPGWKTEINDRKTITSVTWYEFTLLLLIPIRISNLLLDPYTSYGTAFAAITTTTPTPSNALVITVKWDDTATTTCATCVCGWIVCGVVVVLMGFW